MTERITSERNVDGQQINSVNESSISGSVTQHHHTTVRTTNVDDGDSDDALAPTSIIVGDDFSRAIIPIKTNSFTSPTAWRLHGVYDDFDGLDDYYSEPENVQRTISDLYW